MKIDIVNLWINGCKALQNKTREGKGSAYTVPRIICNDGFVVSVQASTMHYCTPRNDDKGYNYGIDYDDSTCIHYEFELGFPSEYDKNIIKYAEDVDFPTGTVYPYTPLKAVLKMIDNHKGLNLKKMCEQFKGKEKPQIDFEYKSDEELIKRFKDMIIIGAI